ncbi:hypothetical protein [Streptomyces sp. NBC_00091]|uniref:hypothetical protein n=1 Tax=Streptomyces sp. NBC_00091 TaxID=2975648 RepID=UPI00225A97C3|nr:hypothetical protein [Streptomyces sp. NBC_00091]MCX5377577.1 hypothetical protein [Streptomyces sp. NBC_00091]
MFKTNRTRRGIIGTAAALGVLAAGVAGGVAIADDAAIKALAPYAQASAKVNADGTREQSQGIKSLTRPANTNGVYCVTFDDVKKIKVSRSTPTATLSSVPGSNPSGYNVLLSTAPTSPCGNAADTLTVYIYSAQGTVNYPFFLVVP